MIRIEEMTAAYVSQAAALERSCFSAPWSEKCLTSELENPLSLWLVAVDGGRLAGYVGSQTVLEETDMMNVAVDPDYRRRGIASMLITRLVEELANRGSHSLTLEVRQSNGAARDMYEKLGFSQVGVRPRYYSNPREDAMILRKEWEP